MEGYQFRTITERDIPSMVEILMSRQEREFNSFPFLHNSFLQAEWISRHLQNLLASGSALGMAPSPMANSLAILWAQSGSAPERADAR